MNSAKVYGFLLRQVSLAAQVLGWEGFWGTVGMAVIGMPLAWVLPGSDIGDLSLHLSL